MKLYPYLHFDGDAKKALNLYLEVFNTKAEEIHYYSENKEILSKAPKGWEDKILHASLVVDKEFKIMLADVAKKYISGDNINFLLDFQDETKQQDIFSKLAKEGTIILGLKETFWGAKFGILKDKFNITWSFNCEKAS